MSPQHALSGSANAQSHSLDNKVNIFLFDLKNEAIEHGFKPDESWTLQLVSELEMTDLKRIHHPIVSLRLQPEFLVQAFQQVKNKLQQSLNKTDVTLTETDMVNDNKTHLAAYPARNSR